MSKTLISYISEEMKYIMELDGNLLIFPDYSVRRVGNRFCKLKKKLGIKEKFIFTLKTFRKTFATHYAVYLYKMLLTYQDTMKLKPRKVIMQIQLSIMPEIKWMNLMINKK